MDPVDIVDGVLRSVLGGRRKRSDRTSRYLSRGARGVTQAALSNPTALLGLVGVAWGNIESLQGTGVGAQGPSSAGAAPGSATPPTMPSVPLTTPPPVSPEPLDDATRMVRLAVSAAQADGSMIDVERAAVLERARAAGVEGAVEQALLQPSPLHHIVAGVSGDAERATLYGLAFSIARADERVSGVERIYLAQLANVLALDPAAVQAIERTVESRIDAAAE